MESYWDKVISESKLISLPEVYLKLQEIISSEDFAMTDVVNVISTDPAITARLLRMVNSSFFGLACKIDTVSHAINYLGTQQVHDLVLSTSIAQSLTEIRNPLFNMHAFWEQSVYSAIAARELAVLSNVNNSERLFVTGLLRDTGHLMMYQSIPDLMQQVSSIAQQNQIALHHAEQQFLGFDFTKVGSQVLENWNLPISLTDAIQHQLHPARAEQNQSEAAILHIAGVMTNTFKNNQFPDESFLTQIDPAAVELTSITADHCIMIDKMVIENLKKVITLLFPQLSIAV